MSLRAIRLTKKQNLKIIMKKHNYVVLILIATLTFACNPKVDQQEQEEPPPNFILFITRNP